MLKLAPKSLMEKCMTIFKCCPCSHASLIKGPGGKCPRERNMPTMPRAIYSMMTCENLLSFAQPVCGDAECLATVWV